MPDATFPHCLRRALFWLLLAAAAPTHAAITVQDDAGNVLTLEHPASRIVSLAPHITELLFAAGAGNAVIAADRYSDYPLAARSLPRIGDAHALDLERLLALKPDLVIAWQSGNDARQMEKLKALGLRVFMSEPRQLDDIPNSIVTLGRVAGTEATANPVAARLRTHAVLLDTSYGQRSPVSVFFEIWSPPIMTVNGNHLIDKVLRLCGGRNVFADLPALTPSLSTESVVAADPEVILASSEGDVTPSWLGEWRRWPHMKAVAHRLVFSVPGDLITRPGPRIFDGADEVCHMIDRARATPRASDGNKQP
jgi:iron complex transport system substrate-binding protein